jgi:hypothetical protein
MGKKRIKVSGWLFRNTGETQIPIGWFLIPEERLHYHEGRNRKWLDADTVEALGLSPVGVEYSGYSMDAIRDGKSNAEIKAEIKKRLDEVSELVSALDEGEPGDFDNPISALTMTIIEASATTDMIPSD